MPNQFLFLKNWKMFEEFGLIFSKKLECEIWIMFLHDYKIITCLCSFQLFYVPCYLSFFFSVLLLLAIMLMQYLCTWGLHIKYSEFKLELFVRKSKSFQFVFYCKMMEIPSFSS